MPLLLIEPNVLSTNTQLLQFHSKLLEDHLLKSLFMKGSKSDKTYTVNTYRYSLIASLHSPTFFFTHGAKKRLGSGDWE